MPPTPAQATPGPEVTPVLHRYVPLTLIDPSPMNPRKHFDDGALDELAASIREKGLIQPVVLRPKGERFEIVVGERRFRAAKRAHLTEIKSEVVTHLTDRDVAEIQIIENRQREDVHPIEEADAFANLMKLDTAYNAKAIAAKIGKSERYVLNRLHYAVLTPEVRKAFLAEEITAGHADLIARLDPPDQKRALKACFDNLFGEDRERGVVSVRSLDAWIKRNVRLQLAADNRQLEQFPELAERVVEQPEKVEQLLQVSGTYDATAATKGLLSPADWQTVERGKKCEFARRAVVVIGDQQGKILDVCTAKDKCKVHWKFAIQQTQKVKKAKAVGRSKAAIAAEKKLADQRRHEREKAERLEKVWNYAVQKVAPKAVPNKPTPAVLKLVDWNAGGAGRIRTWRDFILEELAQVGSYDLGRKEHYARVSGILRGLGVDLGKVERELFPATVDAKKPAAAPAKRKAAKKR
jgi:ParB/RepB/Spo0J family partition protein